MDLQKIKDDIRKSNAVDNLPPHEEAMGPDCTTPQIRRPPLRWFGSKWLLAPWIASHFPAHDHYVEPCFGGGNVLLRKKPAYLETVNDLNGRVVNYFQVLRDRPHELLQQIQLTPWAYDEYHRCQAPAVESLSRATPREQLEDARRFHTTCWMSIHGGPVFTGWRHLKALHDRHTIPADDLQGDSLLEVARRLKKVQFHNLDALDFLAGYQAKLAPSEGPKESREGHGKLQPPAPNPQTLIYFDPPYPRDAVSSHDPYGAWNVDDEFHVRSAAILRSLACYVVVSGYACDLYRDLYEKHGWIRLDRPARTNSGKTRIESLWLSPRTAEALAREKVKQGRLL
jgi:DNA adenine methylase